MTIILFGGGAGGKMRDAGFYYNAPAENSIKSMFLLIYVLNKSP
jgi:hypothetical protein